MRRPSFSLCLMAPPPLVTVPQVKAYYSTDPGLLLTDAQAKSFYGVHADRSFFGDLCAFMTSGPVVVQVLQGEGAVAKNREIMGATNPATAAAGTIRKDFAESIEANSVHGSDSPENAAQEIAFFFAESEICP